MHHYVERCAPTMRCRRLITSTAVGRSDGSSRMHCSIRSAASCGGIDGEGGRHRGGQSCRHVRMRGSEGQPRQAFAQPLRSGYGCIYKAGGRRHRRRGGRARREGLACDTSSGTRGIRKLPRTGRSPVMICFVCRARAAQGQGELVCATGFRRAQQHSTHGMHRPTPAPLAPSRPLPPLPPAAVQPTRLPEQDAEAAAVCEGGRAQRTSALPGKRAAHAVPLPLKCTPFCFPACPPVHIDGRRAARSHQHLRRRPGKGAHRPRGKFGQVGAALDVGGAHVCSVR